MKFYFLVIVSCCFNFCALANENIVVKVTVPSLLSDEVGVVIENKAEFPYVVKLRIQNKSNINLDVAKFTTVIEPKTTIKTNLKPSANLKFSNALQWVWNTNIGDYRKDISNSFYQFPFSSNMKIKICQSDDGPLTSHVKGDYAIDLCAPIGTSISSISDGIVFEVIDHHTEGGADPKYFNKSNRIEILNDNGSRTVYGHLSPNSSKVKIGERVKKGQAIGAVGLTGQTSGPHLHLHTNFVNSELAVLNVETKFKNIDGVELKVIYGNYIFDDTDLNSLFESQIERVAVKDFDLYFNRYKSKDSYFWVEQDSKGQAKYWFTEKSENKKFSHLFDETRSIGLLVPKNGELIFLLNSDGDYVRPLYRTTNRIDDDKLNDFEISLEHSKGLFRGYRINGKMVWLESSKSGKSNFRVFTESSRDSDSVTISNSSGDLLLRASYKEKKLKYSRDKGKTWFPLYEIRVLKNY